ncbi:SPFH domain-containing protein [Streptomyces sp. NPDC048192]|uniref:SPFH domain-containing protein n=1 Tax=unclassified Streptomyces TaxID=2593676 RepID=UPI0037210FD7
MTTTTSHTPPESEGHPEEAVDEGGRNARLIHHDTTDIPVHLLYRDGPDPVKPAAPPLPAAVVPARQGTGEQPRAEGPEPVRRRPLPQPDPKLVERPAPVLPGAVGMLAGVAGIAAGLATSWWAGVLPPGVVHALRLPVSPRAGLGAAQWAAYAGAWIIAMIGFGGLGRGRDGRAWVLGLFGGYRGTVRRTGLFWVNPLLQRRPADVRLRHWRSEAMPAADPEGIPLRVVVLVVWRVRDTARALLGVGDHEAYLRACVEAALARVPVEPAGEDGVTAAGDALTGLVAQDAAPAGLEVFSVQPVRAEYAPEVAAAMRRGRIARLDARQRAGMLSAVVDAVEDTVTRLSARGLVELDDYERKALVRDLTVAFCSGRGEPA